MQGLVVLTGILAFVSFKTCGSDLVTESLNKQLLRSAQTAQGLPIPTIFLALRLSSDHNHAIETNYLNRITTDLHNDIQRSLSQRKPVVGLLSQYTMCLLASCTDANSVTFTVNDQSSSSLITHLKRQMHKEKESIEHSAKPLSNYFDFSGGILALCLAGVRVNGHLTSHLVAAVQRGSLSDAGVECSTDTLAMAGMALSCEKNAGFYPHHAAALGRAISKIKARLETTRPDFHIGNQYSTPIAVMALVAMGSQKDLSSTLLRLSADAQRGTYQNPRALASALIGLQTKSYLDLKNINCQNEKNNLVLEPAVELDLVPLPTQKAEVFVEVVKSDQQIQTYTVHVPMGASLLYALELLQAENTAFTFKVQPTQWGPFLSNVNGEHARQSDRRAWLLLSDGVPLSEGINDFKIQRPHVIIIRNNEY
ncbi:transcobalamin-2 [Gadus morhua]|uniref:Transcobalamin-like C-terminal domain-containing protein n=1 Tax=Gadus morhua TaxID=8049 RepID=A0A8C4ZEC9_GADMO|nr:transcobalamin-2-like [Gadus morhua]